MMSWLADFVVFVIAAASGITVQLAGTLPAAELVFLAILPVALVMRGHRIAKRQYWPFYFMLALWLFGTIITDLIVGSSPINSLKGVARVAFFGIDFLALACLVHQSVRRIELFFFGMIVAMLIQIHNLEGAEYQWKFGGSVAAAFFLLYVGSYFYERHRYLAWICVSSLLVALNLIYAFRSQLLTSLVSMALILPTASNARGETRRSPGYRVLRIVLLIALCGAAGALANSIIHFAAKRNFFTEATQEKFETQSSGKFGVLLGGRPEPLVALRAIWDSPLIGHGSFHLDPKYTEMLEELRYEYGYSDYEQEPGEQDIGIPTHSHITLAWVESGILGGMLWIYILFLVGRALVQLSSLRPTLAPLYSFQLVSFTWDIFFSPFGLSFRVLAAFGVLICYNLLQQSISPTAIASKSIPRTAGRLGPRRSFGLSPRGIPPMVVNGVGRRRLDPMLKDVPNSLNGSS